MQGWRPDATFVIGNTVYSTHLDPQRILFDAIGNRVAGGFGQMGSLEGWSTGMEMLLANGYESYAFAALASLSAPLFQFFDDAGLVISVQSLKPEGRDLMVQAFSSPWGDRACLGVHTQEHLEERMRSWRSMGCLPSFYEDILRLDPYTRQRFLPEVLDKSKLMFCCNMEGAPEDEKILVVNHKTRRRIVMEIGADVEKKYKLDDSRAKVILNKNYGSAAPRFYQYVVRNFGAVKGMVKQLEERFYQDIKKGNHDMHPFSTLTACISTAAMICQKTGILPITPERMTRWLLDAISENHTGRPMFATDPEELVEKFLLEQYEHLVILSGEDDGFKHQCKQRYYEPRPGYPVYVRLEYMRNRLLIDTTKLSEWLRSKGYRAKGFRKTLMDRGVGVRDLYNVNFHGRMNGMKMRRKTAIILDARKPMCQRVIQEWAQKLSLELPPHDHFPPFRSFQQRWADVREQQRALSQPSDSPASPPPPDAPKH